jgi:hypothetical protein
MLLIIFVFRVCLLIFLKGQAHETGVNSVYSAVLTRVLLLLYLLGGGIGSQDLGS